MMGLAIGVGLMKLVEVAMVRISSPTYFQTSTFLLYPLDQPKRSDLLGQVLCIMPDPTPRPSIVDFGRDKSLNLAPVVRSPDSDA